MTRTFLSGNRYPVRHGGVLAAVLAILLVIVIGVGVFIIFAVRGTGKVDEWVVRQVTLIANAHLVPQIGFVGAQFEYPGTLHLSDVTLTAPTGETVIRAGSFVVTLAEVPRWGRPIVIESIEMRDATLRVLRDQATGEFKGLVPFVRRQAIRSPETVPENARLSNVLRMRRIELRNGAIEFDDGSGRPPMLLDQIELALNVDRASETSGGPVSHAIDFSLDRSPIFSLDVIGAASLDTFEATIDRLDLNMDVGEDSYSALPPSIQQILRDREARGQLRVLLTGEGGLRELQNLQGEATVKLDDFSFAAGDMRLTIDQGTMEAHVLDGLATVAPARLDLLGGTLNLTAQSRLSQAELPTTAAWDVTNVQLMNLLRARDPQGAPPTLSGVIVSKGEATANLADLPESVRGVGTLNITEARLVRIPVINQIASVFDAFGNVFGTRTRTSTVDASFQLTGRGVEFEKLTFTNPAAAADATGLVGYDRSLDITATAGPVKKITNMLGEVGRILGAVTGQVIQYRIRGTMQEPAVSAHPLGIGA